MSLFTAFLKLTQMSGLEGVPAQATGGGQASD